MGVPRTYSGLSHFLELLERCQGREPVINEPFKQVFSLGFAPLRCSGFYPASAGCATCATKTGSFSGPVWGRSQAGVPGGSIGAGRLPASLKEKRPDTRWPGWRPPKKNWLRFTSGRRCNVISCVPQTRLSGCLLWCGDTSVLRLRDAFLLYAPVVTESYSASLIA